MSPHLLPLSQLPQLSQQCAFLPRLIVCCGTAKEYSISSILLISGRFINQKQHVPGATTSSPSSTTIASSLAWTHAWRRAPGPSHAGGGKQASFSTPTC